MFYFKQQAFCYLAVPPPSPLPPPPPNNTLWKTLISQVFSSFWFSTRLRYDPYNINVSHNYLNPNINLNHIQLTISNYNDN